MSKKSVLLIAAAVLLAVIIGTILFFPNQGITPGVSNATNRDENRAQSETEGPANTDEAMAEDINETISRAVDIQNMAHTPQKLTVKVGGRVNWNNRDSVA